MSTFIRSITAACTVVALLSTVAMAQQASWPSRPVKVIVPFAAGGAGDIIARTFADYATPALGQSIIVENRAGAGGNIAATFVARSDADGYTFLFGSTGPAALNSVMYKNYGFDPLKDFTHVALVGKTPVIFAANQGVPAKTLKELIEYAKANPDKLNAGFPGNGTLGHISGVLFGQRSGTQIRHVQYRGSGLLIPDLMGGHIDIAMDALTPYVPLVQSGKLKAFAVASPVRLKQLPDVPTASEAGLTGFEASVWYCLLGPAGVPAPVTAKLNATVNEFLKAAKTIELYEKLAVVPAGSTPEGLREFVRKEIENWGPVIRSAKISF